MTSGAIAGGRFTVGDASATSLSRMSRFGARNADNLGRLSAGPWATSKCCWTTRTTRMGCRACLRRRRRPASRRPPLRCCWGIAATGWSRISALAAVVLRRAGPGVAGDIGGDYLRDAPPGDVAMILRDALHVAGMDEADLVCLDEA